MKINSLKLSIVMAEKELNYSELSRLSNVSRTSLSYISSGKNCNPATVGKIAKALEVDVTELLED